MAYERGQMHALELTSVRSSGWSAHISMKRSLAESDSNLRRIAGLSKTEMLRTAREGGGGTAPSSIGVFELAQLLKSCLSARWDSTNLSRGGLFSPNRPYLIMSCLEANKTHCKILEDPGDLLEEGSSEAGWTPRRGGGAKIDKWGQLASDRSCKFEA